MENISGNKIEQDSNNDLENSAQSALIALHLILQEIEGIEESDVVDLNTKSMTNREKTTYQVLDERLGKLEGLMKSLPEKNRHEADGLIIRAKIYLSAFRKEQAPQEYSEQEN